jgi:hypothetical protein
MLNLNGSNKCMVSIIVCLFPKRTNKGITSTIEHISGQVVTNLDQPLLNQHLGHTKDDIRAEALDERIMVLENSLNKHTMGVCG